MTKTKSTTSKSARRRQDLRRNLPKPGLSAWNVVLSREFFNLSSIMTGLLIVVSVLVIWSREQVKVRDGQIMSQTRIKRLDYDTKDDIATEQRREEARRASPRLYSINEQYLTELEGAIRGLPRAVATVESLQDVNADLIEMYGLTEAGLGELRMAVDIENQIRAAWNRYVDDLIDQLRRHPTFESGEFQLYTTSAAAAVVNADGEIQPLPRDRGIELVADAGVASSPALRDLVERAGFQRNILPLVLARLAWDPQPLAVFNPQLTQEHADRAAASVPEVMVPHRAGEVLYRRGDVLSAAQYDELVNEASQFTQLADLNLRWQPRLGILGSSMLAVAFLAAFVFLYYPRVARNLLRLTAIVVLMSGMLAATVFMTAQAPKVVFAAALVPTLFTAIVLLLAYDARLALVGLGLQSAMVVFALELDIAWFVLLMAAGGTMIVLLQDLRTRNSLIRAATVTAMVTGAGAVVIGLLELPLSVEGVYQQAGLNALWAVVASYIVGFVVLGLLPTIERLFDITTGMTLAELRDPRQPLLRQLQQKAPGTYNHSLQVANIAEAAADAVGADSLLVYVGALYHDIGKMSKPEYFIENQSGGHNKHDKLSPAMSLLVIIGHVKDGIELAREYALPRPLQHFIESHHGTTLVEYFFHAAKTQAKEGERKDSVDEVEFRYPGPRPHTKEAAILMLSDCVESATRAMAEPNPSRIENLVRTLARKRLIDGQFNDSGLSFRELALVEDAIISRVSAIHHGRISYPSGGKSERADTDDPPRTGQAATA